jgi:hypothetical protein
VPSVPPLLCFPGGGSFFWWQIGAAGRLAELFDTATLTQTGYSSGALAAVLSRCGVDVSNAYQVAMRLAHAADVFNNPLGLCGKWGNMVEDWLRLILPEDAHERCSGTTGILVTTLTPLLHPERVANFRSREHLIGCLMASTHIPFFMDGRLTRTLSVSRDRASARSYRAVDGGFLEFLGLKSPKALFRGSRGRLRAAAAAAADEHLVLLDPFKDGAFVSACSAHGWSMLRPDGVIEFIEYGAHFVEEQARLGPRGCFASLAPLARRTRQLRSTARARKGVGSQGVGMPLPADSDAPADTSTSGGSTPPPRRRQQQQQQQQQSKPPQLLSRPAAAAWIMLCSHLFGNGRRAQQAFSVLLLGTLLALCWLLVQHAIGPHMISADTIVEDFGCGKRA